MTSRKFAFLAAVAALLVSGIACHLLAKDSAELDEAVIRIADVPTTIGAWQAHEEETDAAAFEQAGAKGYWTRTYVNQRTRESVLVILMCGRPGKMSVHTPEVCYRGAGYELEGQPAAFPIKNEQGKATNQMWTAPFTKTAAITTHLRLYWAWNSRGDWEASASPRWRFRGEPFLYKLYVSRDTGEEPNVTAEADPTAEFLRQLLPEMKQTLFPPNAG